MNPDFSFQIKRLTCLGGLDVTFKINKKSRKFLLSQAAMVKKLKANSDDSEFYEIVLSKFKLLETLDFDFRKIVASQDFYRNLKPMPLVTKIYFRGGFSSATALRAILGNCPNLLCLELFGPHIAHIFPTNSSS